MTSAKTDIKLEAKREDETWIVTPTPGYVLKFKEVHQIGRPEKMKGFINVCHCTQLPPPTDDLNEDELAAKIDKDDYSFRIPLCVGELDCIDDKGGQPCLKVDILVNTVFYEKRLAPVNADFFRHFLCMVMAEAIENKHNVVINPNDAIKLNRKKIGEISPMTICKRPPVPIVHEIASQETEKVEPSDPRMEPWISPVQPKNVNIRLLHGEKLDISLGLQHVDPPVKSVKRLKVKLGTDRVLVLLDNQRSLFDFCIPFNINPSAARSKFLPEKSSLVISAPIVFP